MILSTDPACLLGCYGPGFGVTGTVDAANIGRAFCLRGFQGLVRAVARMCRAFG